MLLASVIILFVASAILIVISSFTKKRGFYYILFSSLTIVALAVTMILSANYNNNFFGFSIISMISLAPLFLTLFDFKSKISESDVEYQKRLRDYDLTAVTQNEEQKEQIGKKTRKVKNKKNLTLLRFYESDGRLFESLALFLSAFFIAFAGLYLGKLSPFGMLAGLPMGIIGLSITYLKDKKANVFDVVSNTLSYVGAGMLLGQIVSVAIYSLNAASILYMIACLALASYMLTCIYTKERRINVMLYCVYLILSIAIILY